MTSKEYKYEKKVEREFNFDLVMGILYFVMIIIFSILFWHNEYWFSNYIDTKFGIFSMGFMAGILLCGLKEYFIERKVYFRRIK